MTKQNMVSIPLPPFAGGTGVINPTAHGIMVAEGSSPVTPLVLGAGQILIGTTSSDPAVSAINSGTGILVANGSGNITVNLAAIASHDILSNITGGSAAPIANTLTATIDAAIGSTQGDILYRNSSVWTVLAPGTSGQFLQTSGAAANPIWASQAGTSVTFTGDSGTPFSGAAVTVTGASTGLTFAASSPNLTLGGTLSLANGGTSASLTASNGGIFYSTASAGAILAGTATARQMLQSGSSASPAWSTSTWPATTTINQLLFSSATNVVGGITAGNFGVLISSSSGVPSWLANGTTGQLLTATTSGTPSWANPASSSVTFTGDSGTPFSGNAVTVTGASTGLTFIAGSPNLTLSGTLAIANGGTAKTSVTTVAAATSWAGWDSNKNMSANNLLPAYTTTATAASTTTLTVASTYAQFFTGSTTQTCVMPVTSTLYTGFPFYIVNNSTGNVTIQSSGANNIQIMAAGTTAYLTCINTGVTTAAGWNCEYAFNGGSGTVNSGTAGQVAYYATTGTAISGEPLTTLCNVPQITVFTSGSGTYTVPAGALYLDVEVQASGGSGAGAGVGAGNGSNGNNSTFGTSLLTANAGTAGSTSSASIVSGGTATGGDINVSGGNGGGADGVATMKGAAGGGSFFGGGGAGGSCGGPGAGGSAYGPGGGGGGSFGGVNAGGGGSGGGYCRKKITTLLASYAYSVGAAPAASGSAGTGGGAGGGANSGIIIITAYFQ